MIELEEQIREACFNLCTSLMWKKDDITFERIEESMQELNEMTEKFHETALFYLENIEALEGQQEIIISAINYIEEVHAIPPLRGNYEWFYHTLGALTEMACPNSRITKNSLDFLKDIESGIKDYRDNILDENN